MLIEMNATRKQNNRFDKQIIDIGNPANEFNGMR
jgi:hypothetical protein